MNFLNRFEINEEDSLATVIGKSAVIGTATNLAATVLTYAAIAACVGGFLLVEKTIKKIKKNPENE